MSTIVQTPDPVLRATAPAVPATMFGTDELATIITDMKEALAAQDDGVAIAAPQIGVSLRIFVVAQKGSTKFDSDMVFINPEFVRIGKTKEMLSEGCLSVRWKYGVVKRSTSATIRAYNEQGNEFVTNGRGLLAQIFQHEIDHLNGVLFIDKAKDVEDVPPQK